MTRIPPDGKWDPQMIIGNGVKMTSTLTRSTFLAKQNTGIDPPIPRTKHKMGSTQSAKTGWT